MRICIQIGIGTSINLENITGNREGTCQMGVGGNRSTNCIPGDVYSEPLNIDKRHSKVAGTGTIESFMWIECVIPLCRMHHCT